MTGSLRMFRAAAAALVLAGGVAVAIATAFAGAQTRSRSSARPARISVTRYSVQIQAVFNAAGNPLLLANFSPEGALATAHWAICSPSPQTLCVGAASRHGLLTPGPRPAGTTFKATAHHLGRTYTARATWGGRVTALSRPTLAGYLRVGALVTPIPARWRGGWGRESDQVGVEACSTSTSRHCVMVSGGQLGCPDHSRAVLSKSVEGWYLFALDARSPADEACAGVGYGNEAAIPVWPVSRTVVRSAPRGPVTAALHPLS